MLKLMKYEFIHSMRTFFIAFVVFLAGCILLPFLWMDFSQVFQLYQLSLG